MTKYSSGYVLLDAPVAHFVACASMNAFASVGMRGEAAGYFFASMKCMKGFSLL